MKIVFQDDTIAWETVTNVPEEHAAKHISSPKAPVLAPLPQYPYHLFPCSDHSFTLNMEAAGSSETLVTIYHSTQHYIPEDHNLQEKSS
jgi:hypothetical protein